MKPSTKQLYCTGFRGSGIRVWELGFRGLGRLGSKTMIHEATSARSSAHAVALFTSTRLVSALGCQRFGPHG